MPLDEMRMPIPGRDEELDPAATLAASRAEEIEEALVIALPSPPAAPFPELERTASGGYICLEDPGEIGCGTTPRGGISDAECAVLKLLCERKMVIEVGTGLAVSTRAIASVARHIDTIDIDPWVQERIFPALRALPNVTAHSDWNAAVWSPADVVFIDGNHDARATWDDILTALLATRPGGIIILHDLRLGSVAEAARLSGLVPIAVMTEHEMGLILLP